MKKETGFIKCQWSLPTRLVERIRAETKKRAKVTGVEYGLQTGVVRQAIEIGLRKMESR